MGQHKQQGLKRSRDRVCWYFKSRWGDYVKATKLEGTDRVLQLLECCDDQLRKDLTRNAGGTLTKMTKDEAMRRLAIREENTMVVRVTLQNMRQHRDKPVRAYRARLRGQASVCKYVQRCAGCGANVHYMEAIVRDVLCRSLGDAEIQIGDKNQDMTLEQALKLVKMVSIPPATATSHRCSGWQLVQEAEETVSQGPITKGSRYLHILWDKRTWEEPSNQDQKD